jgi:hypothetical protein
VAPLNASWPFYFSGHHNVLALLRALTGGGPLGGAFSAAASLLLAGFPVLLAMMGYALALLLVAADAPTIADGMRRAAGLLEFEQVDVLDIDNGARFTTYVIYGEPGQVQVNGAAARLVRPGDLVIVLAYTLWNMVRAGAILIADGAWLPATGT